MTTASADIQSLRSELEKKNSEVKTLNQSLIEAMSRRLSGDKTVDVASVQAKLQSANEALSAMSVELMEKLRVAIESNNLPVDEVAQFENILAAAEDLADGTYTGTAPSSHARDK